MKEGMKNTQHSASSKVFTDFCFINTDTTAVTTIITIKSLTPSSNYYYRTVHMVSFQGASRARGSLVLKKRLYSAVRTVRQDFPFG